MIAELIVRFLIGGAVVSIFALASTVIKPSTFSGLFGGAPSVAIATLSLEAAHEGASAAATSAHWMILGCVAMLAYGTTCVAICRRPRASIMIDGLLAWIVWLVVALTSWSCLREVL